MAEVAVFPARPGVFIQTLVETAERELQSLGVQTIDEAADAALTLSGLQLQDNTELECGKGGDIEGTGPTGCEPRPGSDLQGNSKRSTPSPPLNKVEPTFASNPAGLGGAPSTSSKRKRDRKAKGHGLSSKRRALYQKALVVSNSLEPEELSHSSQGYIGLDDLGPSNPGSGAKRPVQGPLPSSAPTDAHPQLTELLRGEYALVVSDGKPTILTDAEGRIVGWRVGSVGGPEGEARWHQQQDRLLTSIERMATEIKSKKSNGVPRGEHRWAHWGYSYGGGETSPMNKQQTMREREAWSEFLSGPEYIETAKILHDSWATWAPEIFEDYQECHNALLSLDPTLNCVCPPGCGVDLPFACLTANLGPQTVCEKHRDIKNRANGGLCVVKTLGKYDWRRGGHIVLHELGLVVEMRPGDIIFFPSAVITHSTIPIFDGETRYSLVWYSAGGLFRWKNAGFQTHGDWEVHSPDKFHKHQKEGEMRWNRGWGRFSTLAELMAKVPKAPGANRSDLDVS